MSFEKCWVGGKAPKVQRSGCTPRWYCKRRFWVLRSVHWTRIISIKNDSSKSHGYHLKIARLRRTSSWRSIWWYPGKNGGCTQIIENFKIGMSRHLDSSTTTQMAWIMVEYGRSSRSSWAKSVRSSFGRTTMGKAIWENPFEARLVLATFRSEPPPLPGKTVDFGTDFSLSFFFFLFFFFLPQGLGGWAGQPPKPKQYCPCLCEGVAGPRPATPSHKHGFCPPLGSPKACQCSAEHCRPKAGPKVGVQHV